MLVAVLPPPAVVNTRYKPTWCRCTRVNYRRRSHCYDISEIIWWINNEKVGKTHDSHHLHLSLPLSLTQNTHTFSLTHNTHTHPPPPSLDSPIHHLLTWFTHPSPINLLVHPSLITTGASRAEDGSAAGGSHGMETIAMASLDGGANSGASKVTTHPINTLLTRTNTLLISS